MNAVTPITGEGRRPRRTPRGPRARSDQEFLAPALEILETPPSPVRSWLILAICSLAVVALTWAWIGQVDIVAVAAGKIEPSGKVKTVEPLLTGRVAAMLVRDGDAVRQGDVLAQLDAAEVSSELDRLEHQQSTLAADLLRLRTVLTALEAEPAWTSRFAEPVIAWAGVGAELRSAEDGVARRDIADLRAKLGSIESQIAQRQADIAAVGQTMEAQTRLIATLDTLASMRSALVDKEAGSRADWLAARQALESQQVTLATHSAQQADDVATLDVLRQEGEKIWTEFLATYARDLSTAQQQLDDVSHKVEQANAQVDLMTLRSPIEGVVEASTLTSIGQVVTTGQEIMRIVPADAPVVVRAFLPNEDIGFVRLGQVATIKIAAFPFTQYGTLSGRVVALGKDAIARAGDAGRGQTSPIADATGPLVFPVTIELASRKAVLNGIAVDLSAGMQVTAEVNTGRRRILDYLFAPIVEVGTSAMHER